MKNLLLIVIAVLAALSAVGCGKSDEAPTPAGAPPPVVESHRNEADVPARGDQGK